MPSPAASAAAAEGRAGQRSWGWERAAAAAVGLSAEHLAAALHSTCVHDSTCMHYRCFKLHHAQLTTRSRLSSKAAMPALGPPLAAAAAMSAASPAAQQAGLVLVQARVSSSLTLGQGCIPRCEHAFLLRLASRSITVVCSGCKLSQQGRPQLALLTRGQHLLAPGQQAAHAHLAQVHLHHLPKGEASELA